MAKTMINGITPNIVTTDNTVIILSNVDIALCPYANVLAHSSRYERIDIPSISLTLSH